MKTEKDNSIISMYHSLYRRDMQYLRGGLKTVLRHYLLYWFNLLDPAKPARGSIITVQTAVVQKEKQAT